MIGQTLRLFGLDLIFRGVCLFADRKACIHKAAETKFLIEKNVVLCFVGCSCDERGQAGGFDLLLLRGYPFQFAELQSNNFKCERVTGFKSIPAMDFMV